MSVVRVAVQDADARGLNEFERAALAKREAVIDRGLASFVEVGEALRDIRDQRLYRVDYGTFEAYCQGRWNFNRHRASQLIGASEVVTNVTKVSAHLPANEGQARELIGLAPAVAAEVMSKAHDDTGGRVTATAIKRARSVVVISRAIPAPTKSPTAPLHSVKPDGRRQGKYGRKNKHLGVIERITTSLAGLAIAASEITELDGSVTSEEAARLRGDLSAQIRALSGLNSLLKERTK